MIKSLYARIVLVFLAAVLISVILGFFITRWLYNDQMIRHDRQEQADNGQRIIETYRNTVPEARDMLINGLTALPFQAIRIYDASGELHASANHSSPRLVIDDEALDIVLNGQRFTQPLEDWPGMQLLGLPFSIDGEPYALFLHARGERPPDLRLFPLFSQLLTVLLFGSVLIVIAARYVVRPLQSLTQATRKMATGDFRIHLHTRRQDEIGELTSSFNQMAAELQKLDEMRLRFVSDVSHEIQSPLTSIKGFTQALKNKKLPEEERLSILNIIEQESSRLSRLANDLMQLSTLDYDERQQLNSQHFRLDEQLRHVMIALEPQWSAKHQELAFDIDMPEIHIYADRDRLNQLWSNLIGNSIKFTDDYGMITVRCWQESQRIHVQIADTGRGIPHDEQLHIFKPFYKVDKARTKDGTSGNGIGLSIVQKIVDLHQGEILLQSAPGEGAQFTVILPQSPLEES